MTEEKKSTVAANRRQESEFNKPEGVFLFLFSICTSQNWSAGSGGSGVGFGSVHNLLQGKMPYLHHWEIAC